MTAESPIEKGVQPIDLHQRVQSLLVYLDQHGFRLAYELWPDRSAVLWVLRTSDQPLHPNVPWQEPCHEALYLPFSREDVQLD